MEKTRNIFRRQVQKLQNFRKRDLAVSKKLQGQLCRRQGFGINEVIGIAAGIIIAVVVVIPGLQGFAGDILSNLTNWWNNMASSVFTTP